MKLWTGQTVSELGSVVTRTAIPIAAIITLHANALPVGILGRTRSEPPSSYLFPLPRSPAPSGSSSSMRSRSSKRRSARSSTSPYRTYLPSLLPERRLLEGNRQDRHDERDRRDRRTWIRRAPRAAHHGSDGDARGRGLVRGSAMSIAAIRMPERIVEHVEGPTGLRR
jgi:hypothetical protein